MASPVVDALRERPPGARIALVVEGGGMRGAVSGGMALALHELGLSDAFRRRVRVVGRRLERDVAGQRPCARRHPDLDRPWSGARADPPRRRLRGGPVVDVETLVEKRYEQLSPGLFDAVLAADTELHPIGTDVSSGDAVDLHDSIDDEQALRRALRATAALPLLAGGPVEVDGRRFLDAGLSAAIPFRAALADGATHVLVLRSRRFGETAQPPGRVSGALTNALLRRIDPAVARAFMSRADRESRDEEFLAERDADPSLEPAVMSIRPAPDSPVPSRLERDIDTVRAGLDAGHAAAMEALKT